MKKLALLAAIPVVLASCNNNELPTQYDISGSINGTAPSGTVKIALVGGALSTDPVQNIDVTGFKFANSKYTVDLPNNPNAALGFYEIIAYVDASKDGKYNFGETRTKTNINNYLAYSSATQKWIRGTTTIRENGKSVNRINNYDLSW